MNAVGWLKSGDEIYVYTSRENYPEIHRESFDHCFPTIAALKERVAYLGKEDVVIFKLKVTLVRENVTSIFKLDPDPPPEVLIQPVVDRLEELGNLPTGVLPPCTR